MRPVTTRPTRRDLLRTALAAAVLPVAGVSVAGLSAGTARAEGARPRIVATIAQVADMLRNVTGDRAEVTGLLGEGIDPHTYKLTRSDIGRLMAADAVFYNGLLLEGKMTDALVRVATSGKPVFALGDLVAEERLLSPPEFEGQYDPHIWMDVALWRSALDGVVERLATLVPEGRAAFTANAGAYAASLDRLHGYAGEVLASIPPAARVLVTAHDAFGYLGRAYGVEVVGIQGLSTESEAGLRRVEELVALLVERKVPAVFVETSVTDRNVRALIEGAGARGHKVVIGGSLFSDAMGAPGTYEGTYIGMMDHNVTAIARALGGSAPEGGFQDRLTRAG